MDTLKGNDEYRRYLDQSRWDIIVIDECHNVAQRKSDAGSSQRARLAKQLATKSDSLILLSATPHDGSANSFASLIWLLDPTAISDPEDYSRADLDRKDLFVRRFKKDIKSQAQGQFPEPITRRLRAQATAEEDAAFQAALEIPFSQTGTRAPGRAGELQRVGLQKALFSSPAAAQAYARHRRDKLQRAGTPTTAEQAEIATLEELLERLEAITPARFSKYQRLLAALRDPETDWNGQDSRDRLVIFSERIETLKWLHAQLPGALALSPEACAILDGGLSDIEQQILVERIGQEHDPPRVLLCSDVASEGLNLHYFCHRLVHFDLPWSPMVFQQRNGRVDRFGQTQQPRIDYLLTESRLERIQGDLRVIEVLVRKDEQISRNIGDPASILRRHSVEAEEQLVAEALADHLSAEQFEHQCIDQAGDDDDDDDDDWERLLFGDAPLTPPAVLPSEPHRFLSDMYAFAKQAIARIPEAAGYRIDDAARMLRLSPPPDLKRRLRRQLPAEVLRETEEYVLSASKGLVEEAIARAREQDNAWPDIQYLWPQHPISQWLIDRVSGAIGRQRAPMLSSPRLAPHEYAFLMLGLIPNRKGQPLIVAWQAVVAADQRAPYRIEDFDAFCTRAELRERALPNPGRPLNLKAMQARLPEAVAAMQQFVADQVKAFSAERAEEIASKLAQLDALRGAQEQQLHRRLASLPETIRQNRLAQRQQDIKQVFSEYRQWIKDSLEAEPAPFVQVLAGVVGAG